MTRNFKKSQKKGERDYFPLEHMVVQRVSNLEDAQKEWEVIFNAIEEGISIHDTNFNILRANQGLARILKTTISELNEKKCYELIHHLSEPLKGCPLLQAIETKRFSNVDVRIPHLNGEFNISIYPLSNVKGSSKGFVHIMRDITEQKRLQAELLQLEKLSTVGQLISGVAHELNNPLTSVVGYAQLLTMSEEIGGEIKDDLKKLNDEAIRASKIVQNLLAFARKRKPEKSYVNINEILISTIALRAYDLKVNNIAVIEDFQTDLPKTMADPHQLQQVFLNLITNAEYAMKMTHGRGRLEIQTRFNLERTLISVSFKDDGPGISEENLSKIFDPFFTTKETGTGLGLSVSYGIIQEHGGDISTQSRLEKGATFTVELPVIESKEKIVKPEEEKEEERISGKKVLVIDDEPIILDLVRNILEGEDLKVEIASSGEQALAKIEKETYDLIISDLKMPGLNGRSLYQEIEKRDLELSNRILFSTGDIIGLETTAFFERVKADYIYKPFEITHFLEKARRILKRKGT
jgi:two-component system NtrC family sensor kinase